MSIPVPLQNQNLSTVATETQISSLTGKYIGDSKQEATALSEGSAHRPVPVRVRAEAAQRPIFLCLSPRLGRTLNLTWATHSPASRLHLVSVCMRRPGNASPSPANGSINEAAVSNQIPHSNLSTQGTPKNRCILTNLPSPDRCCLSEGEEAGLFWLLLAKGQTELAK